MPKLLFSPRGKYDYDCINNSHIKSKMLRTTTTSTTAILIRSKNPNPLSWGQHESVIILDISNSSLRFMLQFSFSVTTVLKKYYDPIGHSTFSSWAFATRQTIKNKVIDLFLSNIWKMRFPSTSNSILTLLN